MKQLVRFFILRAQVHEVVVVVVLVYVFLQVDSMMVWKAKD